MTGQAGDSVDQLMTLLAGNFSNPTDPADLGSARPAEISRDFAARDKFALLDPPMALLDRSSSFQVSRRTVPDRRGWRRLAVKRCDQLRGEKRRQRRRRCRPSAVADWPLS